MRNTLLRSLPFALLFAAGCPSNPETADAFNSADAGPSDAATPPDAPATAPDAHLIVDARAAALGASCTASTGCESGFCVDGVCCQSACDGACETATCSPAGQCILAAASTVCRAATGVCDAAETCDGSSGACPADGFASTTTECRAAAGDCDVPELCPGDSAACPSDRLADLGASCRPIAGACDLAETCSGTSTTCPADVFASAATTCGAYQCGGAAAECPTSCSRHADCTTGAMCVGGACIVGRWAFTTSSARNGNLGGLAGADALCQGLASAAGLPGTYRAWLSDSTGSPSTRFTRSTIPWVMPVGSTGGVILANDWADLTDGSIDARFGMTEAGVSVPDNIPFTNTTGSGTEWNGNDCGDWTSALAGSSGAYGNTGFTTEGVWTQSGSGGACNVLHRYYCFQM